MGRKSAEMLFDSHCHLDDPRFDPDRDSVIRSLATEGVQGVVCVGSNAATSQTSLALAQAYSMVWAACGIHPHDAKEADDAAFEAVKACFMHPKACALGEIGLDYYYDLSPRDRQRQVFARQILLADEVNKPLILHIRDAHGEAYDILKAHRAYLHGGVVHCYSGSKEMVRQYLDLGLHISFTGSVTFKNAVNLAEAAKAVPLDRLMIETDSPYLAPVPMRGRRNEPKYVRYVCDFLADLHGVSSGSMAELTTRNAYRFYGIAP